jgi:hypothetical protein
MLNEMMEDDSMHCVPPILVKLASDGYTVVLLWSGLVEMVKKTAI